MCQLSRSKASNEDKAVGGRRHGKLSSSRLGILDPREIFPSKKRLPRTIQQKSYGSVSSRPLDFNNKTQEHASNTQTQAQGSNYSMTVLFIITIVAEAARGLLLPSLWPNFEAVGGTKQGYGFLVAAYSLGRMVSVIPIGRLCDGAHISNTSALVVTSFIQAAGHLMYAVSGNPMALHTSRALIGFGSASTSIARAHVTKTVPTKQRTTVLAYLSGVQFVGFAVLPALGGSLSSLVKPSSSATSTSNNVHDYLHITEFTLPAWILVLANMLCALLVLVLYKEPEQHSHHSVCPQNISPQSHQRRSPNDVSNDSSLPLLTSSSNPSSSSPSVLVSIPSTSSPQVTNHHIRSPDITAITICLIINLIFRGVLAQLEAISIPFLVEQFHIPYTIASNKMTILGLFGAALYFSFRPLTKLYTDRTLIAIGLSFVLIGSFPLSITSISHGLGLSMYLIFLGFAWCVAYPIGQTAVLALFSKALGGQGVAAFMGLFSASGAISPLVLSVVATALWETRGRQAVFGFMCCTVIVGLVLVGVTFQRLDVCKRRRSML